MEFSWYLVFIIAAILFGMLMFQKGDKTSDMNDAQIKDAGMYRNYAYLLWGIAVAMAFYYYWIQGESMFKANMCGCGAGMGSGYANMCGGKANMCGDKANMCGGKIY